MVGHLGAWLAGCLCVLGALVFGCLEAWVPGNFSDGVCLVFGYLGALVFGCWAVWVLGYWAGSMFGTLDVCVSIS